MADVEVQATDARPVTEAAGSATPAKERPRRPKARLGSATPRRPTGRRPRGTKQARMIEMLKRPEGATVEQIASARLAASHDPWRHLRRAQEEARVTVEATRSRRSARTRPERRAAARSTGS